MPRAEEWRARLEATVRKIKLAANGADMLPVRQWWDGYLQRSNTRADPAVLARALLPEASGGLARVPRGVVQLGVAEAVMANAVVARPASTITSSPAAATAVRAAAAGIHFEPAYRGDTAVAARIRMNVAFVAPEGISMLPVAFNVVGPTSYAPSDTRMVARVAP